MKHELLASDVRLKCREGLKLVDKTKRYLSGNFKKALLNNDSRNVHILNE